MYTMNATRLFIRVRSGGGTDVFASTVSIHYAARRVIVIVIFCCARPYTLLLPLRFLCDDYKAPPFHKYVDYTTLC